MKIRTLLGLLCLGFVAPVNALEAFWKPAFDCSKANTYVEITVCSSPLLASHDRYMNKLYRAVREQEPEIASEQVEWIRERNRCDHITCISMNYEGRIKELAAKLGLEEQMVYGSRSTPLFYWGEQAIPTQGKYLRDSGIEVGESEYQLEVSLWTLMAYAVDSEEFSKVDLYIRAYPKHRVLNYSEVYDRSGYSDFVLGIDLKDSPEGSRLPKATHLDTPWSLSGWFTTESLRKNFLNSKLSGAEFCADFEKFVSGDVRRYPIHIPHELSIEMLKKVYFHGGKYEMGFSPDAYELLDLYNDGELKAFVSPGFNTGAGPGCDYTIPLELNDSLDGYAESDFNNFIVENTSCRTFFRPVTYRGTTYLAELQSRVGDRGVVSVYKPSKAGFEQICK